MTSLSVERSQKLIEEIGNEKFSFKTLIKAVELMALVG